MSAERKVVRLASERKTCKQATQNWQSGTISQTRMAGALLDAAIRRLGYIEE